MIEVEGILAKLETTNPSGSVKDRMAWYMVKKAEEKGQLKKGMKIIEATSGNTGISFSMISAFRGYEFISIMPESMSQERQNMMRAFGAQIILTPAEEDMAGAVKEYKRLINGYNNIWLPRQFENPDNIDGHEKDLGKEILNQVNVDTFVAGIGTGGTLIGVAKALKKINPHVKIVGVEPEESAVLTGGSQGMHEIQGIGEGFIPDLVKNNIDFIDKIITVKSRDAIKTSEELAKKHGILVGRSSGANIYAAKKLKSNNENIVTILPDRGERYLSE